MQQESADCKSLNLTAKYLLQLESITLISGLKTKFKLQEDEKRKFQNH